MKHVLVVFLLFITVITYADDVEVKVSDDGGFSVKSHDNTETYLKVDNYGALLANLPYGEMYKNVTSIYTNFCTVGWTDALPGEMFSDDYVYFEDNATADRLVIGPNGAGLYYLNLTGSIDSACAGASSFWVYLFKNDTRLDKFKQQFISNTPWAQSIHICGLLSLDVGDYLDMRVNCGTPSKDLRLVNLTIFRIGN